MIQQSFVVLLAALVAASVFGSARAARAESDDLLTGKSLVVKPGKLAKFSGQGTLDLPDAANAPTNHGGSLVIFDDGGTERDAYHLPAKGWKGLGKPAGATGWQYKGTGADDDPCTSVKVTPKAMTATCKKEGVTLSPPFVGPVAAVLSIGGGRKQYCAGFGGTVKKNDATQFKATKAPAPTQCALTVPTWDLGAQQTLLAAGALGGLCYFPDMALVRVPGISSLRLLSNAAICRDGYVAGTYLFEGPDIAHLQSARLVMSHGGPGEFDNGYAGISGIYRHTDGRLYGFYHAEDQEDLPNLPGTQIPGYYASIGAAVSDDDGESWQKLGPVITSSKPKDFTAYANHNDRGIAEPGVVTDPSGRFLYMHYSDHSRVDANQLYRGLQVAMARADLSDGPPVPGQWQKYFRGQFGDAGIGGEEDVVLNGRSVVSGSGAYQAHATFSAYLRRYVMVLGLISTSDLLDETAEISGLYIAFSHDAVVWSVPEALVFDYPYPVVGKSLSWEANILWDDDTEQKGWLVYGYTPRWGGVPGHYMVGRRIEFH